MGCRDVAVLRLPTLGRKTNPSEFMKRTTSTSLTLILRGTIMVFVGWVERRETQHPSWVKRSATQPTKRYLNPLKLMWSSTSSPFH